MKQISGYSKLTKEQKIDWLVANFFNGDESVKQELISYWHEDPSVQKIFDDFSENTLDVAGRQLPKILLYGGTPLDAKGGHPALTPL